MARLRVLLGIASFPEAHRRSEVDFDSIVGYDIAHVESQSLWPDLAVQWKKVSAVLRLDGAE